MITLTELRVGNYLNLLIKKEAFGEVQSKKSFKIKDGAHIDNICGLKHQEDLVEPIPLTPEILQKAQKVFEDDDLYLLPNDVIIKEIAGHWHLIGYARRHQKIIYVHQLQNLFFDLTGEELEIKL